MDTRVKPAYDDLNFQLPSDQLIDPRSLSRRKRGLNHRRVRAGIGGGRGGVFLRGLWPPCLWAFFPRGGRQQRGNPTSGNPSLFPPSVDARATTVLYRTA